MLIRRFSVQELIWESRRMGPVKSDRRKTQTERDEQVKKKNSNLRRASQRLLAEKKSLQVTLACIGDAVITTSKQARITYLNPVAEALSGWSNAEAAGLPLSQVFKIFSEAPGGFVEDPVTECLRSGEVRRLGSDTLLVRRDGQEIFIDDTAAPILDETGRTVGAVLVFRDVTDKRQLVQQLSHQAAHDALTGINNRRDFERRLKRILDSPEAHRPSALLYLDLDQFKVVNDTCGHAAGDMLLRRISALMRSHIRSTDGLARLGGDEFGILLECCPNETALRIASQLREKIRNFRFFWERRIFTIGASIGLVPIPQANESVSSLLIAADQACYAAKEEGGNRVRVYELDDSRLVKRHGEMQWVARINDALRNDDFCLYYQPIVPLKAGPAREERSEILLRLLDEQGRLVLPDHFMPAAEHYGLMTAIDQWVFHHALEALKSNGLAKAPVVYSINISGQSLSDESFLAFVIEEFRQTRVSPSQVCIEITETAAIANLSHAVRFISALKELGCAFALDDFGSGLSSFAYLRSLSIDYLKVAGYFVGKMARDPIDYTVVESIHNIGRVMGIKTIAEHVEDDATIERLKTVGVDYGQGNVLGPPKLLKVKRAAGGGY
jgi:diguanylate cyclase (GGDEF)-like protein/PAS domain S-box-containing protein